MQPDVDVDENEKQILDFFDGEQGQLGIQGQTEFLPLSWL